MDYLVKKAENNEAVLKIMIDDDAPNPRTEWDNTGTMICWSNHYDLGDKHSYATPRDFLEELAYDLDSGLNEDIIENMYNMDLLNVIKQYAVILPLYILDHSGISISTRDFNDRWDSGQVGWTYMTFDEIVKEFGLLDINRATERLKGEIETYDQYLKGDVYYFLLQDKEGNTIDSCGGFYGLDYMLDSLSENIADEYHSLINEIKSA